MYNVPLLSLSIHTLTPIETLVREFAGKTVVLEQQFALETMTVTICRSTRIRKSRRAMFVLRC